ncbi:PQQ-binding-like beta-propeller repeat protein [Falsiroseomonas sp.]|uniref:outer membrane protein assembly factor BamB family protein n=1 Tax=Falsiroseomonas sp. TaxID=2870721 RepID=UPI0027272EE5|nr:PQQ-binding-like beta-propeller repeat protein [Falsiroseomonas sp.]MDO9501756.1 PQQ-binding-like beta-propeller repeat protein [Falsiroseomonas sp.]
MMKNMVSRRAALLGAAALLPGCSSLDGLMGSRKVPLPGERRSVLSADPPLAADSGAAGTVSLPPASALAEWPQAGGPPSHAPGHAEFTAEPRQAWRASIGGGSGYRSQLTAGPIIVGDTVYAVDASGQVSAFALADGGRRWRVETTPENESAGTVGGGAAFADGVLYVATGMAEVLALSPEDGAVRWRVRTPSPTRGAPTVAGGRIFVVTLENHLLALSTEDGRRLWTHRAGAASTLPLGLPAPAVEGEAVVAGFGTGELAAVRTSDGRLLWSEGLGTIGATSLADIVGITGLPVIDRGRVLAAGMANTTIAVDLRSGRRLWERTFGGGTGVASAGDWVFSVTRAGEAVAVGREDGRIRWVSELDPSPAGGRRGEAARFGPPILAGGFVMIPSSQRELLLLAPGDGSIAGRVPLSSGSTLPAALAQGTMVLLGDDGTLMALR